MSLSVIPVKISPQVKSAPPPPLPLHHPCPPLWTYVLSRPFSLPIWESLHVIQIEHWFTNHVRKYNFNKPAPTSCLTSAPAYKSIFAPPHCFFPLSLPKSQSGPSVWAEQSLAFLPRWPKRQSDILLSAEPDWKWIDVMWEMIQIACGCNFIRAFL